MSAAPLPAGTVRLPTNKAVQVLYGLTRIRTLDEHEVEHDGWHRWTFTGLGTAHSSHGAVSLDPSAPTYAAARRALERGASEEAALPELVAVLVAAQAVDGQRGHWTTAQVQRLLRGAAFDGGKRGAHDRQVVRDWLALLSAGDFTLEGAVRRLSVVPTKGRKPGRKAQEREKARSAYGGRVQGGSVLTVERVGRSTTVTVSPDMRAVLRTGHDMPASVLRLDPVPGVQRMGRQRAARVRVGAELYARARQGKAGAGGLLQGLQTQHLLEKWAGLDAGAVEQHRSWERTASDVVVVLDDARRRGATGLHRTPSTAERGDRRVLHLTGKVEPAAIRHLSPRHTSPPAADEGVLTSPPAATGSVEGCIPAGQAGSARAQDPLRSSLRSSDGRCSPRLAPGGHAQAVASARVGAA